MKQQEYRNEETRMRGKTEKEEGEEQGGMVNN